MKEWFNIPVLQTWVSDLQNVWELSTCDIAIVLSIDFLDAFHDLNHLIVVLEHLDELVKFDR